MIIKKLLKKLLFTYVKAKRVVSGCLWETGIMDEKTGPRNCFFS